MFSFLILLPLTLISAAIGLALVTTPQVAEYVEYLSKLGLQQEKGLLRLQIAAHVLSYAFMCFVLAATARTVSAPLAPDRPAILKRLQLILEGIFVSVPSVVLIVLSIAGLRKGLSNWILWLGAGMAAVGLVVTVLATVGRRPLNFFRSSFRPLSITKTDLLGGIALAASLSLFVSFMIDPVESATFLGLFPVLFVTFTTAHLVVAAIFARGSSPIAILSTAVSAVVVLHAINTWLTPREFRHTSVLSKSDAGLKADELLRRREILELDPAFQRWLEHRRPAIEAYRRKNRPYPIFVVAAQGGGIYAGYHAALTLARLYDSCPEFAHHLFAVSSVSGGGLGAAVFAELLRSVPSGPASDPSLASEGCNPQAGAPRLEDKVISFFSTNFLTPVVASAFVFDLPGLLVPQLRLRLDRAMALEYAFEAAWRKSNPEGPQAYGLDKDFYGRWRPEGLAPALFLTATSVNHGVPVLVSQINWKQSGSREPGWRQLRYVQRMAMKASGGDTLPAIYKNLAQRFDARDARSRISAVANILDFRPDLQLATSTAVLLSARFPYVTPPANIGAKQIEKDELSLFDGTKVLELMDGGLFDNSGARVAVALLRSLELELELGLAAKSYKNDVKFHLIQFTDKGAQRHGDAHDRGHFELVTPVVAFNAVRLTRGAEPADDRGLKKTVKHSIYLGDEWFAPELNWLLTKETKEKIEARSGGRPKAGTEACCRIISAHTSILRRGLNDAINIEEKGERKIKEDASRENITVERFIPNDTAFRALAELLTGTDQTPAPATPVIPVTAK